MNESHQNEVENNRWRIRLWPAIVIALAIVVLAVVPRILYPRTMLHFLSQFGGPILGAILIVIWWTFAARVSGRSRWLYPALLFVPAVALGMTLYRTTQVAVVVYGLPLVTIAWILCLVLTSMLDRSTRQFLLVLAMTGAWGFFGMLRYDGVVGDLEPRFSWRWERSNEEEFLAERQAMPVLKPTGQSVVALSTGDWPGFRGAARDGIISGVSIDPNWKVSPPTLLWKHRVGPGWGSFAVVGDRLYTQEQLGGDEAIICYSAETGAMIWEDRIPGRFEEAMAGAGPRATPTFADGRIYAQGANGKVTCTDAAIGSRIWTADVMKDAAGVLPQWGFSGSPLVIDGLVIVFSGGPSGKGTAAFKSDSGELAWTSGNANNTYSSAQAVKLRGESQVLMFSSAGVESFRPTDGKLLWTCGTVLKNANRVTQPMVIGDTDIIIGTGVGDGQGLERYRVSREGDTWSTKPVWTSKAMRPYYNDAVVCHDHAYGFDGERFCCVDLKSGKEKWKDGLYGHGQVLLLADQSLLIVQAEDGKVALVNADPEEFDELGKFQAITDKTWNHPVVAHGKLFVRNGKEAACYQLKAK